MSKYIAIDIGASSGRAIVASLDNKLELDEINRFTIEVSNGKQKRLNLAKLRNDIIDSITLAMTKYSDIKAIGIDTWAVDFVCLDKKGKVPVDPMFYRDNSFIDALNEYEQEESLLALYQRTGIQIQAFNTFFQLQKLKENYSKYEVTTCLLLPDYLNYYLTGVFNTEFTNKTTTQLMNLDGSEEIKASKYFSQTRENRRLGQVKAEFNLPYEIELVSVASHDTASAHVAIPEITAKTAFLSSGTWSLLGVEVTEPVCSEEAFTYNFSNEGCYSGKYRFQKNIMGLWMIVNLAKEIGIDDFAYLSQQAANAKCDTLIDVNDQAFFSPSSMKTAIDEYIQNHNLEVPENDFAIARVVYRSLAHEYAKTIKQIESILNRTIDELIIVGGGAKAEFMNQQIAEFSAKTIKVFPYECSALGNIIVQAIELGEFNNIEMAHKYIAEQLEINVIGEE